MGRRPGSPAWRRREDGREADEGVRSTRAGRIGCGFLHGIIPGIGAGGLGHARRLASFCGLSLPTFFLKSTTGRGV